jgi:hypothetical protein
MLHRSNYFHHTVLVVLDEFLDFNTKAGREDIFKQTIGNKSLHKISNDKGAWVVNSATPKI